MLNPKMKVKENSIIFPENEGKKNNEMGRKIRASLRYLN